MKKLSITDGLNDGKTLHPLAQAINELTWDVAAWADANFPGQSWENPALGVYEEFGELCHAILKSNQGIRGTKEEHREAQIDAACDLIIFAMNLAGRLGADGVAIFVNLLHRLLSEDVPPTYKPRTMWWANMMAAGIGNFADAMPVPDFGDPRLLDSEIKAEILAWLAAIIMVVYAYVTHELKEDLASELRGTWMVVKNRNWQKNPAGTGFKVVAVDYKLGDAPSPTQH